MSVKYTELREKYLFRQYSSNAQASDHVNFDFPINSREEDKLDFNRYAKSMAETIKTCRTPMVISINGGWGCGKTSFLKLIQENLQSEIARQIFEYISGMEKSHKTLFRNFLSYGKLRRKIPYTINSIIKSFYLAKTDEYFRRISRSMHENSRILRFLRERNVITDTQLLEMLDVLNGASPDCSYSKICKSINSHDAKEEKFETTEELLSNMVRISHGPYLTEYFIQSMALFNKEYYQECIDVFHVLDIPSLDHPIREKLERINKQAQCFQKQIAHMKRGQVLFHLLFKKSPRASYPENRTYISDKENRDPVILKRNPEEGKIFRRKKKILSGMRIRRNRFNPVYWIHKALFRLNDVLFFHRYINNVILAIHEFISYRTTSLKTAMEVTKIILAHREILEKHTDQMSSGESDDIRDMQIITVLDGSNDLARIAYIRKMYEVLDSIERYYTKSMKKYRISWFNTWQYSNITKSDFLNISFLQDFIKSISFEDGNAIRMFGKKLFLLSKRFLKKCTTTLKETGSFETYQASLVIDALISNNEELNSIRETQKLRTYIENAVKTSESDLHIVFIDDLDRVPVRDASYFLETLKTFLDISKCVFVIAMDYRKMHVHMRQTSFSLSPDKAEGIAFFEKIIQLPYNLPITLSGFLVFLEQMCIINNIPVGHDAPNDSVLNIIQLSNGINPRGAKKIFSTYHLYKHMMNVSIGNGRTGEIMEPANKRLLIGVICIQLYFADVYSLMLSIFSLYKTKDLSEIVRLNEILYNLHDESRKERFSGGADDIDAQVTKLFNQLYDLLRESKKNAMFDSLRENSPNIHIDAPENDNASVLASLMKYLRIAAYEDERGVSFDRAVYPAIQDDFSFRDMEKILLLFNLAAKMVDNDYGSDGKYESQKHEKYAERYLRD